jgi:hypothetical protein
MKAMPRSIDMVDHAMSFKKRRPELVPASLNCWYFFNFERVLIIHEKWFEHLEPVATTYNDNRAGINTWHTR